MIRRLVIRWFLNSAALFAAVYLVAELFPGSVALQGPGAALLASAVLALISVTIKPVLVVLTFPLTMLTFGLFLFVINAFSIWLAAQFLSGFTLVGVIPALVLTIAFTICSWIVNSLISGR